MLLFIIKELKVLKGNVYHCFMELTSNENLYKRISFQFPVGYHL